LRLDWSTARLRIPIGRPSPGSCLVYPSAPIAAGIVEAPVRLDAGAALNISGPKGTRQLPRRTAGVYSESFGSASTQLQYLEPGAYTIENGSGGADVGGFRAAFSISPALSTTVQQSGAETTVTWRGGDPAGLVTISGFGPESFPWSPASFTCTERVNAGRFTVPAYVLTSFPAGTMFSVTAGRTGYLPHNRFRAPGLDVGYISFSSSEY
jgi:hypothetical protein